MASVYPALEAARPLDRVLIVAPHIDDETIGAGGYAVDAASRGAEVSVVFLTAGDCSRIAARLLNRKLDPAPSDYVSVGRARIREAAEALNILGVQRSFLLGYPDRGLQRLLERPNDVIRSEGTGYDFVHYPEAVSPGAPYTLESVLNDLQTVLAAVRPTTIIAPVNFDLHPDHRAAAELTDRALGRNAINRLGYLVHSSFLKPLFWNREALLLPPSRMRAYTWATYAVSAETQRRKHAALQAYRSQQPYTILLRNAFIRSQELYFAYAPMAVQVEHAPSFACAPYSQQPSSP